MNTSDQKIAIAKACGWEGVPCQQIWYDTKYWRSVTPPEISAELGYDYCAYMNIARWLKQPDGQPYILRNQPAGSINGLQTYTDKPVLQSFLQSEYRDTYSQYEEPPVVEPLLDPFVEYLPDYLNDLNAMHSAELTLSDKQAITFRCIATQMGVDRNYDPFMSNASQRAEAFLKTLNLWKQ
jgi:hypothetical protein